jgi:hypothetical protein
LTVNAKKKKKAGLMRPNEESQGYIAESELYPALKFRYKPFFVLDRSAFLDSIDKLKAPDIEQKCAQVLAKRVTWWDLEEEGADGVSQPVPISVHSMLRLVPALAGKLFNVVASYIASDDEPQEEEEEASASAPAQAPQS